VLRDDDGTYSSEVTGSFLQEAGSMSVEVSYADADVGVATSEKATVLVVDDNNDMVKYLVRILGRYYAVRTASNGKEALERINNHAPDLVISDIMMPVMDGVEMLRQIKSSPDTRNIPVMLLSARAGEESRIEGYEIGTDD